jgi:phosphate transport system permease protein
VNFKVQEARVSGLPVAPKPSPEGPPSGIENPAPSPVRKFLLERGSSALSDRSFRWLMLICALSIFFIVALIDTELVSRSQLTIAKFGLQFFFKTGC